MIPELESSTELALLKNLNRAFGKIAPKANKEAPASAKAEAKALKAKKVEPKDINSHTHTHRTPTLRGPRHQSSKEAQIC